MGGVMCRQRLARISICVFVIWFFVCWLLVFVIACILFWSFRSFGSWLERHPNILHMSFILPYAWVMGCGATEATGLGFVCFVVINPCVLLILGFFVSSNFTSPSDYRPGCGDVLRSVEFWRFRRDRGSLCVHCGSVWRFLCQRP